jgi:hypothetical protein
MFNPACFRAAVHIAARTAKRLAEMSDKRVTDVTATEFSRVGLDSGREWPDHFRKTNSGETRMKLQHAWLRACLLASIPFASFAANEPVIVGAESDTLGAHLTTGTDAAASVNYITATENSGANSTPERAATYTVTFLPPGPTPCM